MAEGDYEIRFSAVSLAQKSPFSDWHHFKIVYPVEEAPTGMIMLGISITVSLVVAVSISYYYKHKIMTILKRQNETVGLLTEMEPTDFHEVKLNHLNVFDRLANISEDDDDDDENDKK